MKNVVIAVLGLLLLFFAATETRLLERGRRLEARIADLERQAKAKLPAKPAAEPAPAPVTAPVVAPPKPAPAVASAPPAVSSEPTNVVAKAQAYLTRTLEGVDGALNGRGNWGKAWVQFFNAKPAAEELKLSEQQKHAIEALRKSRDLQTQVFRDQIQKIEEQTELTIRQLLDPEQLKSYDAQTATNDFAVQRLDQLTLNGFVDPAPSAASGAPATATPAYLGVQAVDAEGGGAKISEVLDDSAAKRYGLQPGDVVLEFGGQKIGTFAQLSEQIRATPAGSIVTLRINRGGAVFDQGVELGARPK